MRIGTSAPIICGAAAFRSNPYSVFNPQCVQSSDPAAVRSTADPIRTKAKFPFNVPPRQTTCATATNHPPIQIAPLPFRYVQLLNLHQDLSTYYFRTFYSKYCSCSGIPLPNLLCDPWV